MGETLTFAQITEIKMLHLENSIRLLYKIRRDMQPFFSFYEHQVKRTDLCVNHRAGAERARGDQGVPVTYKGWSTGCWAAEGNLESNKQHVTRGIKYSRALHDRTLSLLLINERCFGEHETRM